MDMITLFCEVDDFFLLYEQYQAQHQLPEIPGTRNRRGRPRCLYPSEVMTILVLFHLCPHINPITKSARIDFSGWRLLFSCGGHQVLLTCLSSGRILSLS